MEGMFRMKKIIAILSILCLFSIVTVKSEAAYVSEGNGKVDRDSSGLCKVIPNKGYKGQASINHNGKYITGSWVKAGKTSTASLKGTPKKAKFASFKKE